MSNTIVSFQAAIPILAVGGLATLLTLLFCCYLWRLRRQADSERGFKRVRFANKKELPNDTCPVCLEEFLYVEELGICTCGHSFHTKCISTWLYENNTCPMCNQRVKPNERSRLVGGLEALSLYRTEV
ncbi:RING finger protein 122-like [Saccoglossus kowalevskii]|uniref:RING finger protein 122-like n=1 Tax=Saccoglossus kowalevskii TaxID=10224 RepID=A0ABM0N131_SACKO|nr:PREDICTED: RING finger protein 122-like [Saccoglossus kowalevskii]